VGHLKKPRGRNDGKTSRVVGGVQRLQEGLRLHERMGGKIGEETTGV